MSKRNRLGGVRDAFFQKLLKSTTSDRVQYTDWNSVQTKAAANTQVVPSTLYGMQKNKELHKAEKETTQPPQKRSII